MLCDKRRPDYNRNKTLSQCWWRVAIQLNKYRITYLLTYLDESAILSPAEDVANAVLAKCYINWIKLNWNSLYNYFRSQRSKVQWTRLYVKEGTSERGGTGACTPKMFNYTAADIIIEWIEKKQLHSFKFDYNNKLFWHFPFR